MKDIAQLSFCIHNHPGLKSQADSPMLSISTAKPHPQPLSLLRRGVPKAG